MFSGNSVIKQWSYSGITLWHRSCLPFWSLQGQDDVIVQTPEITQQVHHATDEEKLASTGMIGQTTDSQEENEEPKGNMKAPGKKQPNKGMSDMKGMFGPSEKTTMCRI